MALLGAHPEHSPTRPTTTTLVVQGLLACLRSKGVLAPADLAEIEGFALDVARDLRDRAASGSQVAGARLEEDVRSFFAALLPDDEAGPQDT